MPARDGKAFFELILKLLKNKNMEQKQFILAINQICEEKGISMEKAFEIVEAALASAYKKDYGKRGEVIQVELDKKSGNIKVFQVKTVAEQTEETEMKKNTEEKKEQGNKEEKEQTKKRFNPDRNLTIEEAKEYKKDPQMGDEIRIQLPSRNEFGRIAAQTAKQVMIQKIREAEKEAVYDEFKNKEGEVVNGIIQRIEGKNVFVDIGKAVGVLYPSEQIVSEFYRTGQRLKVYIMKVEKDGKEASLILSRTSSSIIGKLFELEVPEIFSKTVEIKSIAREAGSRTKVAVHSNEEGIDPVGSCVGQRGTRIQTIINELGGEKVDIIEWSGDTRKYIQHALSPAKISRIEINENRKSATAYVAEDQLSLAIGKQGQNVRLAAKLTGWKIDILEAKKEEKPVEEENKAEVGKGEKPEEKEVEKDKKETKKGRQKHKEKKSLKSKKEKENKKEKDKDKE